MLASIDDKLGHEFLQNHVEASPVKANLALEEIQ
jgi:hypothetical protein